MDKLLIFGLAVFVVIVAENILIDIIANAGITGFTRILFLSILPGSFIIYLLTHIDQI